MAPPIQRLESHVAELRDTAERISAFAREWKEWAPDDSTETLLGAYSAISDIANELDNWTNDPAFRT
jgi:hypothetical protein